MTEPVAERAMFAAWLLHLAGDIHQRRGQLHRVSCQVQLYVHGCDGSAATPAAARLPTT